MNLAIFLVKCNIKFCNHSVTWVVACEREVLAVDCCLTLGLLRMVTHWSRLLGFEARLGWPVSDFSSSSSSPPTKKLFGFKSVPMAQSGRITSSKETRWSCTPWCYMNPFDTILSVSIHTHTHTPFSALLADASGAILWEGMRGCAAGSFLQQVSVGHRGTRPATDVVMGFFNDSIDSISVCSKKMYLIASSRAKAKQITCSMSIVIILQEQG